MSKRSIGPHRQTKEYPRGYRHALRWRIRAARYRWNLRRAQCARIAAPALWPVSPGGYFFSCGAVRWNGLAMGQDMAPVRAATIWENNVPVAVPMLTQVVAVSWGRGPRSALKADALLGLGLNSYGQPAMASRRITAALTTPLCQWRSPLERRGRIAAAVPTAWRSNPTGRSGLGLQSARPTRQRSYLDSFGPVQIGGLCTRLPSGGDHYSLALKSTVTVWHGAAIAKANWGNGTKCESDCPFWVRTERRDRDLPAPLLVPNTSLALKADGTVWAWGIQRLRPTGRGAILTACGRSRFRIRGAIAVAAGGAHSIAILAVPLSGHAEHFFTNPWQPAKLSLRPQVAVGRRVAELLSAWSNDRTPAE